jgi:uncharacterized delta-60 repeat protein
MSTYSVYNINIDNKLTFPAGPTAGYVLSINADGSTSWVEAQGGGGAGAFNVDTNILNRFTRLTPTGDFDLKLVNQAFVGGLITDITGSTVTTKNGSNVSINSIALDSNNKIYALALNLSYLSKSTGGVVRLNEDGSIDTSYNPSNFGFSGNTLNYIILDSNNKIIVVGNYTSYSDPSTQSGTAAAQKIIRLNADGSRDQTFNPGLFGDASTIFTATVDSDDKIYVGGSLTGGIRKYNNNGSLDSGFDYGTGFNGVVNTITIDSNGKIYVGGSFTQYKGVTGNNRIIRLNDDGSKDTGFDNSTGFNSTVRVITIDSNGKIYCGGDFTTYKGVAASRIIRLNDDGSIDTAFDYGTGFNNTVNSIAIDSNGKIYVVGTFISYKGVAANRIIRLNTDGSIDTAFDYGTGFNNIVNSIVEHPNGKIYVGGGFTSYKDL